MLLPQEPRAALDPTMRIGRQVAGRDPVMARRGSARLGRARRRMWRGPIPPTLSGGMAQRVLVAAALVGRAPLLIADEPTKGLDAASLAQTQALLASFAEKGRSLLVITHDIATGARARRHGRRAARRQGRRERPERERCSVRRATPIPAPGWRPIPRAGGRICAAAGWTSRCSPGTGWASASAAGRRCSPGSTCTSRAAASWPSPAPAAAARPRSATSCSASSVRRPAMSRGRASIPIAIATARAALRQRYQKLHQDPASVFLPGRALARQFADLAEVVPGLALDRELPPLLDRLKLDARLLARRPGEVSGGEAQRLALARILLLQARPHRRRRADLAARPAGPARDHGTAARDRRERGPRASS